MANSLTMVHFLNSYFRYYGPSLNLNGYLSFDTAIKGHLTLNVSPEID